MPYRPLPKEESRLLASTLAAAERLASESDAQSGALLLEAGMLQLLETLSLDTPWRLAAQRRWSAALAGYRERHKLSG